MLNIFYLDKDPVKSARMMCDKHTGCGKALSEDKKGQSGKMIVESAQMLANAFSLERLAQTDCPYTQKGTPRKHSYYNHPCSQWVLQSIENWKWLLKHANTLVAEKVYRGGDIHFCSGFISWCNSNQPILPNADFTDPPQALPDELKEDYTVDAYRAYYYLTKYKGIYGDAIQMKWTKREKPDWWPED